MAWKSVCTDAEGSIDEKGIRKYTLTYKVWNDGVEIGDWSGSVVGPGFVSSVAPFALYDSYAYSGDIDDFALLRSKKASRTNQDGIWQVVCEFDSSPFEHGQQDGQAPGSQGDSPAPPGASNNQVTPPDRPWTLKWGSVKFNKVVTKDLDNKPVVNAANQPFIPAVEIPDCRPFFTVTKYVAASDFPFSNIAYYTGSINGGAWNHFGAYNLRITEYDATSVRENGQLWMQLTVTIEINPDGPWNPVKVLNAGTYHLPSLSGPPRPILDSEGNPISAPVPLTPTGQVLASDGTVNYCEFNLYREADWTELL